MKILIHEKNGVKIAELSDGDFKVNSVSDALDLMGNISTKGINRIIVQEKKLSGDFFDLKTKIAGEILQKFSTYGVRLAIVGDFSKYESKSLSDFIFECNNGGRIMFLGDIDEAIERLSK